MTNLKYISRLGWTLTLSSPFLRTPLTQTLTKNQNHLNKKSKTNFQFSIIGQINPIIYITKGGMPLDEVIYTGKITEEELKKEINKLLNQFLRELENNKKEEAYEGQ